MNSQSCAICGATLTAFDKPIVISLKKAGKIMDVEVPACATCRMRDTSSEWRRNMFIFLLWIALVIAGAVAGRWEGAILGFGLGYLLSIPLQAVLTGRGRACQSPDIKKLKSEGWDVNHVYSRRKG